MYVCNSEYCGAYHLLLNKYVQYVKIKKNIA